MNGSSRDNAKKRETNPPSLFPWPPFISKNMCRKNLTKTNLGGVWKHRTRYVISFHRFYLTVGGWVANRAGWIIHFLSRIPFRNGQGFPEKPPQTAKIYGWKWMPRNQHTFQSVSRNGSHTLLVEDLFLLNVYLFTLFVHRECLLRFFLLVVSRVLCVGMGWPPCVEDGS